MVLQVESRPSDSPYIARVWRSRSSDDAERMTSVANVNGELVVWEHRGRVHMEIRGPEPQASRAPVPEGATFFGILFAAGAWMPHLPFHRLVDRSVEVPDVTRRRFWLHGSTWDMPDYDNAEEFVRRLVREGVLDSDPLVPEVLRGASPGLSERTIQRRFIAATGLTRAAIRQIERARQAAVMLQEGTPVAEVVHELGYFDQPHLARSLTRFVGRTATQLSAPDPAEPLSLLYKT
jgi:hypothetical protein